MNTPPPIKRHEVFLIIALLYFLIAHALEGWQALSCASVGLGYIIASIVAGISND